jgi:hypothetical protein
MFVARGSSKISGRKGSEAVQEGGGRKYAYAL